MDPNSVVMAHYAYALWALFKTVIALEHGLFGILSELWKSYFLLNNLELERNQNKLNYTYNKFWWGGKQLINSNTSRIQISVF